MQQSITGLRALAKAEAKPVQANAVANLFHNRISDLVLPSTDHGPRTLKAWLNA